MQNALTDENGHPTSLQVGRNNLCVCFIKIVKQKPTEHSEYQSDPNRTSLLLFLSRHGLAFGVKSANNSVSNMMKVVVQQQLFFIGEYNGIQGRIGVRQYLKYMVEVSDKHAENSSLGKLEEKDVNLIDCVMNGFPTFDTQVIFVLAAKCRDLLPLRFNGAHGVVSAKPLSCENQ
jgi:hypothetical protein